MDFPHVEKGSEERFARLYPVVADNQAVKEAAKDVPGLIKFDREGGVGHYKLYESKVPAGMDVDKTFGAWATEEAKAASMAEAKNFKAAKKVVEGEQKKGIDERYPENIRYYPAVGAGEGKDRDAFIKIAEDIAKQQGKSRTDIIKYNNMPGVQAFVSKVGPIPELSYWQSDEAKGAWAKEGEKLAKQQQNSTSRASDVVERAALQAEGKDFIGKYGKGLMMPSTNLPDLRANVEADIRGASTKDLQAVRAASEKEFKLLERKLYAIQITAVQKKDPPMSVEEFNALKPEDRRNEAGVGLPPADFKKLVAFKNGFFAVSAELKDRGEHLSVDQARDLKDKKEATEKAKPVDEKGVSKKDDAPAADKQAEAPKGRASSRGAAAAAALAGQLGRG